MEGLKPKHTYLNTKFGSIFRTMYMCGRAWFSVYFHFIGLKMA